MPINGRGYDWEDMNIILPSGEAIGITEIKYSDSQDKTPHYGKGAVPRGYGRGNYEASGSMVLDRDEWERLTDQITENDGIYDHEPFTIIVNYANDDMGQISDTLPSVAITKNDGGGGAQGDNIVSAMTVEFKIMEPILWNGKPAKGKRFDRV